MHASVSESRLAMKAGVCALMSICAITAAPEPKAIEIAREMMQAMGGEAAWKQAQYVRFDFVVTIRGQVSISRADLWDKQTGRYRLEDRSASGAPAVMLFNTRDGQGAAYVDGKKLEGAAAAAALHGAGRTSRTDVDWLALPWRWLDPGVHLVYLGEKSLNKETFDLVEVTVDQPGAEAMRYNAYVSRRTHLMEHSTLGAETSLWDWQYTTTGGIQLAIDHIDAEKGASISMGNVKVLDKIDEAFLTDPARKLSQLR